MIARPLGFTHSRRGTPRGTPRLGFTLIEFLVVLMILAVLAALIFPSARVGRAPARRSQCKNNLKQIGLALHNYAETYGAFPPAYTVDANGQPLHSWRTLILPFVDEKALYDQIDLSKPWDDPANAVAFQKSMSTYRCPSALAGDNNTTYLAITGELGALAPDHARPFSEFVDGLSNTLLVVEVPDANAVPWMAPQDADEVLLLSFGKDTKRQHSGGMHGLMADGGVRFFSQTLDPATLQGLCTVSGLEELGEF